MNQLRRLSLLLLVATVPACTAPMSVTDFADETPTFKPLEFFNGHTTAWGMMETGEGLPAEEIRSDNHGHVDADGTLVLDQKFTFGDGSQQERELHLIRIDDHRYEGTATDMEGVATGEAYGNTFHWTYVLQLSPDNSLKDVDLEQWMYLQPDGTLINRDAIRKAGLTVGQITEHFERVK